MSIYLGIIMHNNMDEYIRREGKKSGVYVKRRHTNDGILIRIRPIPAFVFLFSLYSMIFVRLQATHTHPEKLKEESKKKKNTRKK